MARKPQVAVEPRAGGRWAVQTDGTARADSLHDRKTEAVARGRQLAENKRTELVIKNEGGKIVANDSHGNDPRRIKG
jgi:Uncharacterized protein conserved in bacteria (DUF2188)